MKYSTIDVNNSTHLVIQACADVAKKLYRYGDQKEIASDLFLFWKACRDSRLKVDSPTFQNIRPNTFKIFEKMEAQGWCHTGAFWGTYTASLTASGDKALKAVNGRLDYYLNGNHMESLFEPQEMETL